MALIGVIAFVIAFKTVGELGLRGEAGSIVHWVIKFIVFSLILLLYCIAIKIISFVINNWIVVIISVVLLLLIYVAMKYANTHQDSILNRKLFYLLFYI